MKREYDLAIVGAGIVGLAHALAASRLGASVLVIDRDQQANGASVRNFGFITVTGQQAGQCWQRAMRSRNVWAEIAPEAHIAIEHSGLVVAARRPEAIAVLKAFRASGMGEQCEWLEANAAQQRFPMLSTQALSGALWSPHELRVESRTAIPRLATFLAARCGVTFLRNTMVTACGGGQLETSAGRFKASRIVIAANDDFLTLYPQRIAAYGLTKCKLHMMRAEWPSANRLPAAIMSDLSLVRYLGYSELREAQALRDRLSLEQAQHLAHGIHLIVVQSADGSLVVGDSHHYAPTPDPFAPEEVDQLIMDEFETVFAVRPPLLERWTGIYPSSDDRLMLIDAPEPATRLVIVTSGTGASTAFAIAEEVVGELFGETVMTRALPQ